MEKLRGACIIGQSGGPTSVINASTLGAIMAGLDADCITRVLGARYGIEGVLNDNLIDLNKEDKKELELLKFTPASALGSCRHKLVDSDVDDSEYKMILEVFKKYDVRYFFYNGGNDSMDTCNKISKYMEKVGYECRVMGIPKTIDNDLFGTDHCPGYGSAAKYIATSCMELIQDARVYQTGAVIVLEIMGRNAGWLTAAAALATEENQGPDLIYLPEINFSMDTFLDQVEAVHKEKGGVVVAVSEGIKDKDGVYVSSYSALASDHIDAFGHSQMGGLGVYLADKIKARLGISKARAIEFSLLQRSAAHCASKTDADEAYMAGQAAVENAIQGKTDFMVGFERYNEDGEYQCKIKLLPLSEVANAEKTIPKEWINKEGNGLTKEFIEYARPLIIGENHGEKYRGLPRYAKLKNIKAE